MAQTVGFRAVGDLSNFTKAQRDYVRGMHDITNSTIDTARQVNANMKNFDKLSSSLNQSISGMRVAEGSVNSFSSSVQQGIAVGIGITAFNALMRFADGLTTVGRNAVEVVRFYELLSFSIGTLIAQEERRKNTNLDVAQSLEAGDQAAKEYLYTLQNMAIFSPFTTTDIASGFKLLKVYGASAKGALNVTKATIDWASAAGINQEVLGRVFLAMGQIRAEGRLLARDVLQLAQAGVPVRDILADAFGYTQSEITDMMRKGIFPANTALEAIIKYMQEFEGSGKRVAGTLAGLITSLEDIWEISQRDLFGGIFESFKPFLQQLVDIGASEEWRAMMVALGETIGGFVTNALNTAANAVNNLVSYWQNLTPATKQAIIAFISFGTVIVGLLAGASALGFAINALINPFTIVVGALAAFATAWVFNFNNIAGFTTEVASNIGQTLNDITSSVAQWGASVVQVFSQGIISAVSVVVDALSILGQVMAYWLAPGSPPRILPDLDIWGRDAAEVWLSGWAEADFSAFDTISDGIKSLLSAMAAAGKIDKDFSITLNQSIRDQIADVVDEFNRLGSVSSETLERIRRLAGPVGDELTNLINATLEYTSAMEHLTSVQDNLNRVSLFYSNLLRPLRDRLMEISYLQSSSDRATEIERLQRIVNSAYASEARKAQAQLEIDRLRTEEEIERLELDQQRETSPLESELTTAQTLADEARSALAIYQERLGIETDTLSIMGEQLALVKQVAAESVKAGKAPLAGLDLQLAKIKLQQEEMQDVIAAARARYIIESDTSTEAEKTTAQLELQAIAIRKLQRREEAVKLGLDVGELDKLSLITITLEDMGIKLKEADGALDGLSDGLDALDEIDITTPFEEFQKQIEKSREQINLAITDITNFVSTIDDGLPTFFKLGSAAFYDAQGLTATADAIRALGFSDEVIPALEVLKNVFLGLGVAFATYKIAGTLVAIAGSLTTVGGALGIVALAAGAFAIAWNNNFYGVQQTTQQIIADISAQLGLMEGYFNKFALAIDFELKWLGLAFQGFLEQGFDSFLFQYELNRIWTAFNTWIQGFISSLPQKAAELGNKFDTEFVPAATEWVNKTLPEMLKNFRPVIDGATQWVIRTGLPAFLQAFGTVVLAIGHVFVQLVPLILSAMGQVAFEVGRWITAVFIPELGAALMNPETWRLTGGFILLFATAFKDLVVYGMKEMLGIAVKLVSGLFSGIAENLKTTPEDLLVALKNTAITIAGSITAGFISFFTDPKTKSDVWQSIRDWFSGIIDNLKQWLGIASPSTYFRDNIGKPIIEGIIEGIRLTLTTFDFFAMLTDKVIMTAYENGGKEWVDALIDAFKKAIEIDKQIAVDAIKWLRDEIFSVDILQSFKTKAEELGSGLIDGITAPFKAGSEAFENAKNAVTGFIDGLIGAGKEEGEIQSPSKRTEREIGRPMAEGIANGISGFDYIGIIADMASVVMDAFSLFLDVTADMWDRWAVSVSTSTTTMSDNVKITMFDLFSKINTLTNNFTSFQTDKFFAFSFDLNAIVTLLAFNLIAQWESMSTNIKDNTNTLVNTVTSLFNDMKADIVRIIGGAGGLSEQVKMLLSDLVNWLNTYWVPDGEELGEDFAQGIADGILNKIDAIESAARAAAQAATDAARDAVQAESPARVPREKVGRPIAEGIAVGITDNINLITAAMSKALNVTVNSSNVLQAASVTPSQILSSSNYSVTNNYYLNVNSQTPTRGLINDFRVMQVIG